MPSRIAALRNHDAATLTGYLEVCEDQWHRWQTQANGARRADAAPGPSGSTTTRPRTGAASRRCSASRSRRPKLRRGVQPDAARPDAWAPAPRTCPGGRRRIGDAGPGDSAVPARRAGPDTSRDIETETDMVDTILWQAIQDNELALAVLQYVFSGVK